MRSLMLVKRYSILALVALAFAQGVNAAPVAPDQFVKNLIDEVMIAVESDRDIKTGNIHKINGLVEEKILPCVNFEKIAASAVGRFWSQATPEQKKQIIQEFRQVLIYTYSGALAEANGQKVKFMVFRGDPADPVVDVKSQVINPKGGDPVQLDYRLEKSGDSWKIIDVNVLGMWLVETYRGSFASEINKNGIDGLVKTLTEKNRTLAAQNRPAVT